MPSYPALALALLAAALALLPPCASGLILEVEPSRQRCLQEVLSRHDLVKGGYKLLNNPTEGERSGFLVRISGPSDNTEYSQADLVSSKFSFTADTGGSHKLCFTNGASVKRTVELEWASGAAAIDYSDVARVEQLKPLELEMRKLEDRLAAVRKEMQFQREREEAHRDTSETTAGRVMWFSILTIAIVVVQGVLQVLHLWTFFSRNKFPVSSAWGKAK